MRRIIFCERTNCTKPPDTLLEVAQPLLKRGTIQEPLIQVCSPCTPFLPICHQLCMCRKKVLYQVAWKCLSEETNVANYTLLVWVCVCKCVCNRGLEMPQLCHVHALLHPCCRGNTVKSVPPNTKHNSGT